MNEFFALYKDKIIYCLIVIALTALLLFLTNLLHKWLKKIAKKRHPHEEPNTVHLIRRILKTFWILIGLSLISFAFIEQDLFDEAKKNLGRTIYLGFVAILTIVGGSIVQTLYARAIKKKIHSGGDPTSHKFMRYLAVFSVYFIGVILAILAFPALRGVAQTALGGAGVLAIIVGVASQEAMANIVGGVFIISFKPFKIGDVIKVSGTMVGTVMDITLRHTIIRNYKNKMIVIPNAVINKAQLINYNLGELKCCEWIELGISYNSSIDSAKKIIQEECEAHPSLLDNRSNSEKEDGVPKVIVRVLSLDDSAVTIRAWAWAKDYPTAFVMKCELIESIKKRFDEEGVEIPFPHRTMVFQEKQLQHLKDNLQRA